MILVQGTYEDNFFDLNPEFRLITIFKEFESACSNASQIMWGIYYLEDPNSKLYRIKNKDERKQEIENNLLHEKINWDSYENLIQSYIELTLSDNARSYKIWREKARDLDNYIKTLDFEKNAEVLLKLFKEAKSIWATLDEIQKRTEDEDSSTTARGGGQLSARDKKFQ